MSLVHIPEYAVQSLCNLRDIVHFLDFHGIATYLHASHESPKRETEVPVFSPPEEKKNQLAWLFDTKTHD